jgi:hypothetical protein
MMAGTSSTPQKVPLFDHHLCLIIWNDAEFPEYNSSTESILECLSPASTWDIKSDDRKNNSKFIKFGSSIVKPELLERHAEMLVRELNMKQSDVDKRLKTAKDFPLIRIMGRGVILPCETSQVDNKLKFLGFGKVQLRPVATQKVEGGPNVIVTGTGMQNFIDALGYGIAKEDKAWLSKQQKEIRNLPTLLSNRRALNEPPTYVKWKGSYSSCQDKGHPTTGSGGVKACHQLYKMFKARPYSSKGLGADDEFVPCSFKVISTSCIEGVVLPDGPERRPTVPLSGFSPKKNTNKWPLALKLANYYPNLAFNPEFAKSVEALPQDQKVSKVSPTYRGNFVFAQLSLNGITLTSANAHITPHLRVIAVDYTRADTYGPDFALQQGDSEVFTDDYVEQMLKGDLDESEQDGCVKRQKVESHDEDEDTNDELF